MIGSFVFILGLFIGSFLNVCVWRIPRKESIVTPPSHCPHCGKRLQPWDLIPVISYLLCAGKCRYCGQRISLQYLVMEVLTGLLFLLTYWQFGVGGEGYLMLLWVSALIVISGIDAKHRIIPDVITIPGMIVGLVAAIFSVHISLLDAVYGLLVGGGLFFLIAVITRGGMGGGDLKLMAFIGSFLGFKYALLTIFFGSAIGSIFGLTLILTKKAGLKSAIPYGPFLAAGGFIAALYGNEIIQWYVQHLMR